MKRILLYTLMCLIFLGLVFALNKVYVGMQNNVDAPLETGNVSDPHHADDEFHTNLPLVTIDTNNQRITKNDKIIVEISLYDNDINYLGEVPEYTSYAELNYRGNSSYLFEKKQYRIEFKKNEDGTKTNDISVLGMPEASDWILNGPFLDRSLMRNYLGYSISNELLRWAPDTEYCELFVDGEYMGLYIMIEAITNDDGRLNLTDFSLISGACSYVIRMDRAGDSQNPIITYGAKNGKIAHEVSINYPTYSNILPKQQNYIVENINTFEKVLYSDAFDDPDMGYSKYIDVDCFVDYFIINEFMMNTDAGFLSTYIYKDLNSKIYITTWDFNNCYDNLPWDIKSFEGFYLVNGNWFNRLIQDKKFVDKIIARYQELRLSTLSNQSLYNMIDENYIYIEDAANRNFEIWGYTFEYNLLKKDNGELRDPESYDEAIALLKDAIKVRGAFLDDNIEKLYEFCVN